MSVHYGRIANRSTTDIEQQLTSQFTKPVFQVTSDSCKYASTLIEVEQPPSLLGVLDKLLS